MLEEKKVITEQNVAAVKGLEQKLDAAKKQPNGKRGECKVLDECITALVWEKAFMVPAAWF